MSGADNSVVGGLQKSSTPRGFTLVEVLIALLILVGVAPALLMLGTRTTVMLHASAVQRELLGMAAEVTDSLRLHGASGAGERRTAGGTVTWSAGEGRGVQVEAFLAPGPGRLGLERVMVYQAQIGALSRSEVEL